ncbi:MAG: META domain-containing protein [Nodosilinea sp.]
MNGFGGCNQFGAAYHLVGDRVVVDPLRATQRACDGPIMDQEAKFLDALQKVNRISLKAGESLTLNLR